MQKSKITCDRCSTQNDAFAFRCHKCGTIFDGSAGNTLPPSRGRTVLGNSSSVPPTQSAPPSRPRVTKPRPHLHAGAAFKELEADVAIITFSNKATVQQEPVPPSQCGPFSLNPHGCTNELEGLRLAGEIWRTHCPDARLNIILFGDGVPNSGAGFLGFRAAAAALEEGDTLKHQHARIATVGFRGPTIDFAHLRSLASSPALAIKAGAGDVTKAFLRVTQSLTQHQQGQADAELYVFTIDESGSMSEGTKKSEVEEAVKASLDFLKQTYSTQRI